MKKAIPYTWKVNVRKYQRHLSDLATGQWWQLASNRAIDTNSAIKFQPRISLTQPLGSMATDQLERKKHNLKLAIQKIQDVAIEPGQVFSFWHLVGNPKPKAGYVRGRTITDKGMVLTIGGGLCQLSGLLYFLALKSGLTPIERHAHTHDIYTDATRFAPLGSDATVVYGYKDLRFQNNLLCSICFQFSMNEGEIEACLCADRPLVESRIEFLSQLLETGTQVEVIRYLQASERSNLISSDFYPPLLVPTHLQ
jgi:vancomycin resistance protein VanW